MYVHSDTIQCGEWRRVRRRPNGSDIYCDIKEELQTEAVTPTNAIDINTISDPIEEDYMYFTSAQTERAYPRENGYIVRMYILIKRRKMMVNILAYIRTIYI